MNVFVITENGIPKNEVFTSLIRACESAGVKYNTAARGKRTFLINNNFVTITPATVCKIKGRGINKNLLPPQPQ